MRLIWSSVWVPRSRGDRPGSCATAASASSAPPLARGSTQELLFRRARVPGSPAHAGIDPRREGQLQTAVRFPRSRGDRPALLRRPNRWMTAPPLARGSTPSSIFFTCSVKGSPARVGIDLSGYRGDKSRLGLPRSRGDRPLAIATMYNAGEAPPLARGSTRRLYRRQQPDEGSPARVGIDLSGYRGDKSRLGLPRSRGDRPVKTEYIHRKATTPPLARGSTIDEIGLVGAVRSSAARHVWTARRVQVDGGEIWRRFDCGHVSGLLMRHHGRRPRWVPRMAFQNNQPAFEMPLSRTGCVPFVGSTDRHLLLTPLNPGTGAWIRPRPADAGKPHHAPSSPR